MLLVGLHAIRLDQARALEGLAQQCRQLAHLGLRIGRNPAHSAADPDDRVDRHREDEERDQRQQPVLVEHDPDQENDGQRILADAAEDIRRGAAQQRGVAGEPRDQGTARMGMEIGEVGAHQPGEQRDLHIGDHALADAVHQHRLAVIGETLDDGDSQRSGRRSAAAASRRVPTKMRSRTGCISQARSAVLPAAAPISRKAIAIRGACGRMKSRASRHTRAAVRAPSSRIGGFLNMGPRRQC